MAEIDFEKIVAAAQADILGLVQKWTQSGRIEGREYVMLNPTRPDEGLGSFKINLETGAWADFAGGERGKDVVSFCKYVNGLKSMYEAAEMVQGLLGITPDPGALKKARTPAASWSQLVPVPADAPPPFQKHFLKELGKVTQSWAYKNPSGQIMGYIYRFDPPGKKKVFWPLTFWKGVNDIRLWRWKGFNKPRPLYGLDLLEQHPEKRQVLIVEGEKTADAARELFMGVCPVVTWPNGADGVDHADFSPLADRKVVIWPDNDEPGVKAADRIAGRLAGLAAAVKIIINSPKAPKGWDLADGLEKGATPEQVLKFLKANLRDPAAPPAGDPPGAAPVDPGAPAGAEAEPGEVVKPVNGFNSEVYPFRVLGYDNNTFYYLPDGSQQIVRIRGEQHDEKHITAYLAPVDFFEKHWTAIKKRKLEDGTWQEYRTRIDWRAVKRFIIWEMQYRHGVYEGDDSIRGPGIWKDAGRYVIHLGDRLKIAGQDFLMSKIETKYIYEKKRSKEKENFEPLQLADAGALLKILERFSWMKPINPTLLAGWIVAGVMGGALPWRPHLWINGPQSCGKSSVLKDVVRRVLGGCVAIFIEGATTEAGLRQQANHCSFPILFDEAESTDRRGQVRMEQIIELMRSSASPEGGKLLKGTPGGSALTFDVQSCFCLASISNNSKLAADVSRIVNLEMIAHEGLGEKWEVFRRQIIENLNPEWAGKFRARVFAMLPIIRQNIDAFIKAVRDELDSQRFGDVYGVLLGAGYSLLSDTPAADETAHEFVKKQDWTEERQQKFEKDEISCLTKILQRIITVKANKIQDKTLWELMECAARGPAMPPRTAWEEQDHTILLAGEAQDAARRYGLMYKQEDGQEWIMIANNNAYLEEWLKDTQYVPNWQKWLKRIRAEVNGKIYEARPVSPRQFEKGGPSVRGVMVPYPICELYMKDKEAAAPPITVEHQLKSFLGTDN